MQILLDYTPESERFDNVKNPIALNIADNTASTPLMRAVINGTIYLVNIIIFCKKIGSKEIVQMLIAKGADMKMKDIEGNTALHHACYEHKAEIAILLVKAGADDKAENNQGKNALEYGPVDIGLKLLALKKGESIQ